MIMYKNSLEKVIEKTLELESQADNKLTIDKKTFLNADTEAVKELFNGQSSLSYLVATRATALSNTAYSQSNSSSLYTVDGTYASQNTGSVINGYF